MQCTKQCCLARTKCCAQGGATETMETSAKRPRRLSVRSTAVSSALLLVAVGLQRSLALESLHTKRMLSAYLGKIWMVALPLTHLSLSVRAFVSPSVFLDRASTGRYHRYSWVYGMCTRITWVTQKRNNTAEHQNMVPTSKITLL